MNKIDLGNIYGLLVLTMLILYGCAGDTYHVIIKDSDIDDQVTVSNPQPITVAAVVSSALIDGASGDEFNLANYSSEETRGPYTPDTINLPEGRIVHMYVYDGGYTPETGTAVNFALYKATSAGVLTPTAAQYDIKLSPGTYNFYALSEFNNASDKTPPFSNANGANGEKTNLSNELD